MEERKGSFGKCASSEIPVTLKRGMTRGRKKKMRRRRKSEEKEEGVEKSVRSVGDGVGDREREMNKLLL